LALALARVTTRRCACHRGSNNGECDRVPVAVKPGEQHPDDQRHTWLGMSRSDRRSSLHTLTRLFVCGALTAPLVPYWLVCSALKRCLIHGQPLLRSFGFQSHPSPPPCGHRQPYLDSQVQAADPPTHKRTAHSNATRIARTGDPRRIAPRIQARDLDRALGVRLARTIVRIPMAIGMQKSS